MQSTNGEQVATLCYRLLYGMRHCCWCANKGQLLPVWSQPKARHGWAAGAKNQTTLQWAVLQPTAAYTADCEHNRELKRSQLLLTCWYGPNKMICIEVQNLQCCHVTQLCWYDASETGPKDPQRLQVSQLTKKGADGAKQVERSPTQYQCL